MALVFPDTPCALGGKPFDSDESYYATSGCFLPREHRLFRFCDAPIHWSCYEQWDDQEEFARAYFLAFVGRNSLNPYWGLALKTDRVFVELNPGGDRVAVHFAATGTSLGVRLRDWSEWLTGEPRAEDGLRLTEQEALREVLPLLRREVPDRDG